MKNIVLKDRLLSQSVFCKTKKVCCPINAVYSNYWTEFTNKPAEGATLGKGQRTQPNQTNNTKTTETNKQQKTTKQGKKL